MIFEKGYLYHIYNQGNNRQNIFYNRKNYLFFLQKINKYILPYADVLAWCLMPNHFHLMVRVNRIVTQSEVSEDFTYSVTQGFPSSEALSKDITKSLTKSLPNKSFNNSIGILLRTYTRAINKQNGISGSLFRKETKAECINCFKGLKPLFIESGISLSNLLEEKQYPQVCFDYIHQNPVKAGLVKKVSGWEFSSARDYAGLRNGKLISRTIANEYGLRVSL